MAISPSQSLDKEVLYLGLGALRGGLNLHRFDHLQVADVSRTRTLLPRSRLCLGILTCAEGMWQKDGGTSTATTKWLSERGREGGGRGVALSVYTTNLDHELEGEEEEVRKPLPPMK